MSKKSRNAPPLFYEVDYRTGELRLVKPGTDKPYDPPPKAKPETRAQIDDRLRRQRRHLLEQQVAHLQNMAAKAVSEEADCLRRYRELGQFDWADAYQARLYAEALEWRASAKVYQRRAERIQRWFERTNRQG